MSMSTLSTALYLLFLFLILEPLSSHQQFPPTLVDTDHVIDEDEHLVRGERSPDYGKNVGGPLAANAVDISPVAGKPPKDIIVTNPCGQLQSGKSKSEKCGFEKRSNQRLTNLMSSVSKLLGLVQCVHQSECEKLCDQNGCNYLTIAGPAPYIAHMYLVQDSALTNGKYSQSRTFDSLIKKCPSSAGSSNKKRNTRNADIPPKPPSVFPQLAPENKPNGGGGDGGPKVTPAPDPHHASPPIPEPTTRATPVPEPKENNNSSSGPNRDKENSPCDHNDNARMCRNSSGVQSHGNSSREHFNNGTSRSNHSASIQGNSSRTDRQNSSSSLNSSSSSSLNSSSSSSSSLNTTSYKSFSTYFNRQYKDDKEREARAKQFDENVNWMKDANSNAKSPEDAKVALNAFSDEDPKQFTKSYCGATVDPKEDAADKPPLQLSDIANLKIKPQVDWRKYNMTPPVRYQGKCGACYAFASSALIASHDAIERRKSGSGSTKSSEGVQPLSPQYLIDCSPPSAAKGCTGGRPIKVLEAMTKDSGGLPLEACNRYKASTSGSCKKDLACCQKRKVPKFVQFDVSGPNEKELMAALLNAGPVLTIVNINKVWQFYNGEGIIKAYQCDADERNHAVTIVSYDFSGPTPFYWVENSWSTSWGKEGYAKLEAGTNACGVAKNVVTACAGNCGDLKALFARDNVPK